MSRFRTSTDYHPQPQVSIDRALALDTELQVYGVEPNDAASFVAEVVVGSGETNFSRLTDSINESIAAVQQTFTGL